MIVNTLKKILPIWMKITLRNIVKFFKYKYRRVIIFFPILKGEQIKIIIGAAETYQDDWYSTNEQWLDVPDEKSWKKIFKGKTLITNVVAEHVFEHLTYEECGRAFSNIYNHMSQGGRVRIAVPDGYHPDSEYLRHVGIGGIGDDAADHKQLFNADVLCQLLSGSGFVPEQLEGFSSNGELINKDYSIQDGFIFRSRKNETAEKRKRWAFSDADTSLIVDGVKRP
jgi:predicted SAM-dependent methyltransferase